MFSVLSLSSRESLSPEVVRKILSYGKTVIKERGGVANRMERVESELNAIRNKQTIFIRSGNFNKGEKANTQGCHEWS